MGTDSVQRQEGFFYLYKPYYRLGLKNLTKKLEISMDHTAGHTAFGVITNLTKITSSLLIYRVLLLFQERVPKIALKSSKVCFIVTSGSTCHVTGSVVGVTSQSINSPSSSSHKSSISVQEAEVLYLKRTPLVVLSTKNSTDLTFSVKVISKSTPIL